jgi:hypothetical protein
MRILSSLILLVLCINLSAQSPHGSNFKGRCGDCHTTNSWKIGKGSLNFNHDTVGFPLTGQHKIIECRACHGTLKFDMAAKECRNCHIDVHYQTVGFECDRCHTPESWIVNNITEIHQMSRFPLVGAHVTADCYDCHPSESLLRFEPLGIECYDCHKDQYLATTNPNHTEANFSTDCSECHFITSFTWSGNLNHSFFPLTEGHAISDCNQCHIQGTDYANISAECVSCHQANYDNTANPNHVGAGISTNCADCHTTQPGWKPAKFPEHDALFPIYSGAHSGISCEDCHTTPGNYALFSCTSCHEHEQGGTDNGHKDVGGYIYESNACYECHPTGKAEGGFNHNSSNFPLTGAHITTDCSKCHSNGFAGTPTICYACHQPDYTQSANPNHIAIGIQTECEICHTTEPGWKPALYPNHEQSYPLLGAHATIASNCFVCHQGNYVNTPALCYGCHADNYNQTTNPPHGTAGFSTACEACHNVTAWTPATFDHNASIFPLTGAHTTTACNLCHVSGYAGTPTNCDACHQTDFNQTTNPNHNATGIPNTCETCHTTNPGWQPATFPIHNNYYQLTGHHLVIQNDCNACHAGNYNNTPNTCVGCHLSDYNQATDPNHVAAQFSTECATCHTTTAWIPATFDHDAQWFPIYSGHHQGTWTVCSDCHTNPSDYSVFTCITCHQQGETGNQHQEVGGYSWNSNACYECHPTGSAGGAFDHNSVFPLTGAHLTVDCSLCHVNGYPGTPTICYACHEPDYNQSTNPNHISLGIPNDCATCHTTNPGWQPATFPIHNNYYQLTGQHLVIQNDCNACHGGNYNNTPNTCVGCHMPDYSATTNPDHDAIGIGTDCQTCHTTNPGWQPATFPIHNQYWPLTGAHLNIQNNCDACHGGNYNSTPNTCVGCHLADYNQTTDPNHAAAQFPTDCEMCHTTVAWVPSTFDHDGQYFPIYSGSHHNAWNSCSDCHPNPSDYSVFTCLTCHSQSQMDGEHEGVSGYSYNSDACYSCHPNGQGGGGRQQRFMFKPN